MSVHVRLCVFICVQTATDAGLHQRHRRCLYTTCSNLMFTSSLLVGHVPLDESSVLATCQQSAVFDDTYRENAAVVCCVYSLTDFVTTYADTRIQRHINRLRDT